MIAHPFEPAPMPPAALIAAPAHARHAPSAIYSTTIARLAEVTRSVRLHAGESSLPCDADSPRGSEFALPGTQTDPRNMQ